MESPPPLSLLEVSEFARLVARAAGDVALQYFRGSLDPRNKASVGFDPVTAADIEIEMLVRERIRRHFPTHRVIGEELPEDPGSSEYCWIIDPIDGTRGFLLGLPTWGILMGLVRGDTPLFGLMYQPLSDDMFVGTRERSWHYRGERSTRLTCADDRPLAEATLCCTHPDMFAGELAEKGFKRLSGQVRSVRYGTDCWGYASLAMAGADLVFEADLKPCDVAPLIPIVEGAGGTILAIDGGSALGAPAVVAATSAALANEALRVYGGASTSGPHNDA